MSLSEDLTPTTHTQMSVLGHEKCLPVAEKIAQSWGLGDGSSGLTSLTKDFETCLSVPRIKDRL